MTRNAMSKIDEAVGEVVSAHTELPTESNDPPDAYLVRLAEALLVASRAVNAVLLRRVAD